MCKASDKFFTIERDRMGVFKTLCQTDRILNSKAFKMMDATVRARVDSDLKQEAEAILKN